MAEGAPSRIDAKAEFRRAYFILSFFAVLVVLAFAGTKWERSTSVIPVAAPEQLGTGAEGPYEPANQASAPAAVAPVEVPEAPRSVPELGGHTLKELHPPLFPALLGAIRGFCAPPPLPAPLWG